MVTPKDVVTKLVTGIHEQVFRASKGRIGDTVAGMPALVLHHTGRTSDREHTTMLAAAVCEPDRVVLVGSYGGDDREPQWFTNLRAHPDVKVTMRGRTTEWRARVAEPGERAVLWPQVVQAHKGYAGYQERTSREIPLAILEPR